MNATRTIPPASLHEEWSVAVMTRWATAFGGVRGGVRALQSVRAEEAGGSAVGTDPRRAPTGRAEALLRLASDERATAYERALAAERAAALLRRTA